MRKKQKKYPTIFVFEGSIRCYNEGSMLQLYTQITPEEWDIIVSDTIKYHIFITCLKETAIPALNEEWTEQDDWFRKQLEKAVARIRNIDPLLAAKFDQDAIKNNYTAQMLSSVNNLNNMILDIRAMYQELEQAQGQTIVSDL